MVHSFYVIKAGVVASVDNKTAPRKNNTAHGNPAGEGTDSVGKGSSLRSGSVPAGG